MSCMCEFYALHKNDLPFGVDLYFVLPKPKEGFTISEKVFADLLHQGEGEDYGKKVMSFVEIDTGKKSQLSADQVWVLLRGSFIYQ